MSDVIDLLDHLSRVGVEIKLGRIPDEQRAGLNDLDPAWIEVLKRRHLDVVRVLLAKALVAEAEGIERLWNGYPGQRTTEQALKYRDLLFSARAMLPPDVSWDEIAYEVPDDELPVDWTRQLTFDAGGRPLIEARYDPVAVGRLMEEFKR